MAGSGWCHHPLRKTTNELLLMVRRNELACRDQWAHSLWEDGVWAPALPIAGALAGDAVVAPGTPLLPATEWDIAAVLRAGDRPGLPAAGPREDVMLVETRLANDRTPPWRPDDPPAPPRREHDPKLAIKRAREAFRERMRLAALEQSLRAEVPPFATDDATATDAPTSTDDSTAPEEVADSPPDASAATDALGAAIGEARSSEAGSGSDGSVSGEDEAAEPGGASATTVLAPAVAADAADDRDLVDAVDDAGFLDDEDVAWWSVGDAGRTAPFADWEPGRTGGLAEPGLAAAAEEALLPAVSDFGDRPEWGAEAEAVATSADWRGGATPWSVASAAEPAEGVAPSSGSGPGFDPAWTDDDWDEPATPRTPVAGSGWAFDEPLAASDERHEPALSSEVARPAIDDAHSSLDGPLPPIPQDTTPESRERPVIALLPFGSVAPGVPRICRTCRDFRPAEGGERGWCANEWAFAARRVVQPDEVSPCESSVGTWWLPTDELCLSDADISSHGQPTPHLERWLPHVRERAAERKQS